MKDAMSVTEVETLDELIGEFLKEKMLSLRYSSTIGRTNLDHIGT